MHYAIVTDTCPASPGRAGETVELLHRGLRQRGHRVSCVEPGQGTAARSHAPRAFWPRNRIPSLAGRHLMEAWTRARPDAVYVATEGPLGWSAVHVARRLRLPVATDFHAWPDGRLQGADACARLPSALARLRRFHEQGDATLVPTRVAWTALHAAGFPRPCLLQRAVDPDHFHPCKRSPELRAALGASPEAPLLIHVGRLAPGRNVRLALQAYRVLRGSCPGARMVVAGDGPMRRGLEREFPECTFTGFLGRDALARLLASADLCIQPCLDTIFGNVTLEAMASGVAVVAFDRGAAREHLVDGRQGVLVDPGDPFGFLAATAELGGDLPRLRAMGVAARNAVRALSPQQMTAELDRLLARICMRHAWAGEGIAA